MYQIEDSDKLFNFDVEVRPLLNVLVSKTIAQALAEVKEEQELLNIRHDHALLISVKEEAARADKELEAAAKETQRLKEETEKAQELKHQRRKVMTDKVLAWQFAHALLVPQVIEDTNRALEKQGVFYNPLHRELCQWLAEDVYHGADAKVQLRKLSSLLLDGMVTIQWRRI